DPVMPFEHFTRHLSVAWLVSANQPELPCAVEKEKSTEACDQQSVGSRAVGHERRFQTDDCRFQFFSRLQLACEPTVRKTTVFNLPSKIYNLEFFAYYNEGSPRSCQRILRSA